MRLILIVLCCLSLQLSAHEMKSAITKVLFNQRTGNVEIMHRFYVHDDKRNTKKEFQYWIPPVKNTVRKYRLLFKPANC